MTEFAQPRIVQVAVPTKLQRSFDYWCAEPVCIGARVQVPFGTRVVIGFVVGVENQSQYASKLKFVTAVLDQHNPFPEELFDTLQFAARYYHHSLGSVLSAALPTLLRDGGKAVEKGVPRFGAHRDDPVLRGKKRKALLEFLLAGERDVLALNAFDALWRTSFKALEEKGLAYRYLAQSYAPTARLALPSLNAEQSAAIAAVQSSSGDSEPDRQKFQGFLLEGVTGSGKTEVYLALARQQLDAGRSVLVLVPEISLTPQTLRRFEQGLGCLVLGMHSALSDPERAYHWQMARDGKAKVVLGTRSAIFAPLQSLGLIIVDEEHDASYKQMDGFRYHARDLALKRAQKLDIPVLLGSATPSLESIRMQSLGRLQLLQLTQRARASSPTSVQLVDVRNQPLEEGFSTRALQAIKDTLIAGGQALILRNRRGYASEFLCHQCGYIATCPGCERSMTIHRQKQQLRCHYCERQQRLLAHCPSCQSRDVEAKGVGTERIESLLTKLFPEWPIERIDSDTTQRKDALVTMLNRIRDGNPCLIVGTQMLAKGHDLPDIALVVVLGADAGLGSDDFRAPERLAQLLMQTAGRAGRAERKGLVLVQTHQPEHPILQAIQAQNYRQALAWIEQERVATELPPYRYSALLRADSSSEAKVNEFLRTAKAKFREAGNDVQIFGPLPAGLAKRNHLHRAQLMLLSADRKALHECIEATLPLLDQIRPLLRFSVDIDPQEFS